MAWSSGARLPLVELRLAVPLAADQIRKPAPVSILSRSLFAGTDRHDRMALAGAIEDLGASLDAHVGEDRVIVSGAVLAEHLKELLALLVEVITSASYPPDEVKADRNRAADETLIALSQPDVVAAQALRRRLFGTHPYATPIPTPAALRPRRRRRSARPSPRRAQPRRRPPGARGRPPAQPGPPPGRGGHGRLDGHRRGPAGRAAAGDRSSPRAARPRTPAGQRPEQPAHRGQLRPPGRARLARRLAGRANPERDVQLPHRRQHP